MSGSGHPLRHLASRSLAMPASEVQMLGHRTACSCREMSGSEQPVHRLALQSLAMPVSELQILRHPTAYWCKEMSGSGRKVPRRFWMWRHQEEVRSTCVIVQVLQEPSNLCRLAEQITSRADCPRTVPAQPTCISPT